MGRTIKKRKIKWGQSRCQRKRDAGTPLKKVRRRKRRNTRRHEELGIGIKEGVSWGPHKAFGCYSNQSAASNRGASAVNQYSFSPWLSRASFRNPFNLYVDT